jgi:hypothetical protein
MDGASRSATVLLSDLLRGSFTPLSDDSAPSRRSHTSSNPPASCNGCLLRDKHAGPAMPGFVGRRGRWPWPWRSGMVSGGRERSTAAVLSESGSCLTTVANPLLCQRQSGRGESQRLSIGQLTAQRGTRLEASPMTIMLCHFTRRCRRQSLFPLPKHEYLI